MTTATQAAPPPEPVPVSEETTELREQLRIQQERIEEMMQNLTDLRAISGLGTTESGTQRWSSEFSLTRQLQRTTIGSVAFAVQKFESMALERRAALLEGDQTYVARIDLHAVSVACATMDQVVEEASLPRKVLDEKMPANVDYFLRNPYDEIFDPSMVQRAARSMDSNALMDFDEFFGQERSLLELAGLSRDFAVRTLRNTLDYYRDLPERVPPNVAPTLDEISKQILQARAAVCNQLDRSLVAGDRPEREGIRRRRFRLLTAMMGAMLVVSVNTSATSILVPPAVAVSIALGSGALWQISVLLSPADGRNRMMQMQRPTAK